MVGLVGPVAAVLLGIQAGIANAAVDAPTGSPVPAATAPAEPTVQHLRHSHGTLEVHRLSRAQFDLDGVRALVEQLNWEFGARDPIGDLTVVLHDDPGRAEWMGGVMVLSPRSLDDEASRRVVMAHELGHRKFDEVVSRLPGGPELLRREGAQARLRLVTDRSFARQVVFGGQRFDLQAMSRDTQAERQALEQLAGCGAQTQQRPDCVLEDRSLLHPYHELYADLVAVLHARDWRAMAKVVHPELAPFHDFTVEHSLQGWSRTEPHEMLAPARGYTARLAMQSKYSTAAVLEAASQAIEAELRARIADPALRTLSPAAVNERLMRALDLAFLSPRS